VLVVGGGDSALEAAASLAAAPDVEAAISYRGEAFQRAKPANRARADRARAAGQLRLLLETTVEEIQPGSVRLRGRGGPLELVNDAVIVCAGGVLPSRFLHSMGIETETKHGTPLH
jgi:thioredoxin reductase